jgi:hypothetical protein
MFGIGVRDRHNRRYPLTIRFVLNASVESAAGFVEELIWRSWNETALLVLFCAAAFGQNSYNPRRTPYDQPDLQGESGTIAQSRHWSDPRS